jgi:alpha-beta hydrolase superfamily lysophospholipase
MIWGGCFGWFHTMEGHASGGVAAVICPGVGRDSSTGYRSSRFLADKLAQAGYPTLRFSYPGTGDSRDTADEECWSLWKRSVHEAIDTVMLASGASSVILIGIRLGGVLASLAACERDEAVGLVLLEPVLRGSSYVLQLRLEERMAADPRPDAHDQVRVHGLQLSAESLDAIAGVDLRSLAWKPSCKVMLLSESNSGVLRGCIDAWRRDGVEVTQTASAGMEAFFRPTHLADEAFPDPQQLMSWLSSAVPAHPVPRPAHQGAETIEMTGPGWIETPHVFGVHRHLFGMLCRPDHPDGCETIVIIGNSGGDAHDGFARFGVEFARALAKRGIASLRMDFAGLGDSVNGPDDRDGVTHTFAVDRIGDFASAVDLVTAMGFGVVAVQGLCSGAYHALQAAVADPRIAMTLCVNLPWFNLRFQRASPASFARRAMFGLSDRAARCLLLYAKGDPGLAALEMHFGPSGCDLAALPGCDLAILPELDHDLTRPEMRRLVISRSIDFIEAQADTNPHALPHTTIAADATPARTALLEPATP